MGRETGTGALRGLFECLTLRANIQFDRGFPVQHHGQHTDGITNATSEAARIRRLAQRIADSSDKAANVAAAGEIMRLAATLEKELARV